jgi:hypothetical protein
MTNEELDRARVDEAIRTGNGIVGSVALIAARLAREGWTPPVAVDPEVGSIWKHYNGGVYEVIAIANTLNTEKYPKAVIHKNRANGTVWTRRADDWHRSYTQQDKTSETPVDPDLDLAKTLSDEWGDDDEPTPEKMILRAIKLGRALAAEAKPGVVWVKHDGSTICPVDRDIWVLTKTFGYNPCVNRGKRLAWQSVSFYCVITQPEDAA